MFDKLITVNNYIQNICNVYDNIVNSCKIYSNNLILINSNTPFSTEILYKSLKQSEVNIISPSLKDIFSCDSLGEFLRLYAFNNTNIKSVLILDIAGELNQIFSNIPETVDTINVNRDLFTDKFHSTIIIASPKLTYAIRRHARDFWSCVNIFADTTKWFCNPVMPPLVNIKDNTNVLPHLINIHKKNQVEYSEFIYLYRKIKKRVIKYDNDAFLRFFEDIKQFSYPARSELFYALSESLAKSECGVNLHQKKIDDMRKLAYREEINVNTIICLAEYFFKFGCYSDAKICYQRVNLYLSEYWDNEYKEITLAFLSCNILICKYMEHGVHSPQDLELELQMRFRAIENELSDQQKYFIDDYLFLVNVTLSHHTYAQHKDILDRLKKIKRHSFNMLSFAETYSALSAWENFNSNDFSPILFNLDDTVLSDIYLNFQCMVRCFGRGEFKEARNAYKSVKRTARSHGYMQMLKFAEIINNNMIWLYNETEKYKI